MRHGFTDQNQLLIETKSSASKKTKTLHLRIHMRTERSTVQHIVQSSRTVRIYGCLYFRMIRPVPVTYLEVRCTVCTLVVSCARITFVQSYNCSVTPTVVCTLSDEGHATSKSVLIWVYITITFVLTYTSSRCTVVDRQTVDCELPQTHKTRKRRPDNTTASQTFPIQHRT